MTRPLRLAVLGFGAIAQGHLAGLRRIRRTDVTVVIDSCPPRRAHARRELPGARVLAALDELDPDDVDVLLVCTPPAQHIGAIEFGLGNDLEVVCEKPLVLGLDEAARVQLARESSAGWLFPSHNYLRAPSIQALHEVVGRRGRDRGRLVGHFRTLRVGHARGVPEWRPHWRRERAISGGGILRDHGPHSLYVASSLVGSTPSRVRCDLRRPSDGPYRDTEDYAFVELAYADGSWVSLELDWNSPVRQTSYLITGEWGHGRVIDDRLDWSAGGRSSSSHLVSDFDDPTHSRWFQAVWEHFLDCRRDQAAADHLLDQALMTVRVLAACYRSSERGEWVDVGRAPVAALTGHGFGADLRRPA